MDIHIHGNPEFFPGDYFFGWPCIIVVDWVRWVDHDEDAVYVGPGKKGPGKKGPGKNGPVKTVRVKTVLGKNGPGKKGPS